MAYILKRWVYLQNITDNRARSLALSTVAITLSYNFEDGQYHRVEVVVWVALNYWITEGRSAVHRRAFVYYSQSITGYRQTSNIRRIKFQNLNVSRLVLQMSLPNSLKPDVESRTKM